MTNTRKTFTLAEIASPDFIATMQDEVRTTFEEDLRAANPLALVSDDDAVENVLTLDELAQAHLESSTDPGWKVAHNPMTAEEAWEWAIRDLVFGGFCIVGQLDAPVTFTIHRDHHGLWCKDDGNAYKLATSKDGKQYVVDAMLLAATNEPEWDDEQAFGEPAWGQIDVEDVYRCKKAEAILTAAAAETTTPSILAQTRTWLSALQQRLLGQR